MGASALAVAAGFSVFGLARETPLVTPNELVANTHQMAFGSLRGARPAITPPAKGDLLKPPAPSWTEVWHQLIRPTAETSHTTGQPFPPPLQTHAFLPRHPARPAEPVYAEAVSTGTYKTAALSPDVPYGLSPARAAQTQLIGFDSSAFPYFGSNPRTGGGSYAGGRYSDNRVLVHVPAGFDVRKPAVIVVFFHGHGATLARDVRDRQKLPQQISESGINAVLVAPQLAVDAADSSAGKFWQRGGLKRFLAEAAGHLARVYGDPRSEQLFATLPIVIFAYSGGFHTAAWSLHVGEVDHRVKGVVLLDALYGEMDKFSSWIARSRSQAFFVSAYTDHNKQRDEELVRILSGKGIAASRELKGPLKPGTVAFLETGSNARHRDYVTNAWTRDPVKDVLLRMAAR